MAKLTLNQQAQEIMRIAEESALRGIRRDSIHGEADSCRKAAIHDGKAVNS